MRPELNPSLQEELSKVLAEEPIVYCEIGARKGARRFHQIGRFVHYYGFEPQSEDAEKLKAKLTRDANVFRSFTVLPRAVMGRTGNVHFNVLRHRGCSSVLSPNSEVIAQFTTKRADTSKWPQYFEVVGAHECDAISLDEFVEQEKLCCIHFLGLDTQGTEGEILKGGQGILSKSTLLVHVEMETVPLYRGQPLMTDIMALLGSWGFRLISLDNVQYISRAPAKVDDLTDQGELISVDGLFCRNMTAEFVAEMGGTAATVVGCMLVLFDLGFRTLAIDMGRRFDTLHEKRRNHIVRRLADALEVEYRAEETRARPLTSRVHRMLQRVVPAQVRRSIRAWLPL